MVNDEHKRYRGQRGPGKKPTLRNMSVRLPTEVVDFFGGSTIRIREALVAHVHRELCLAEQDEA